MSTGFATVRCVRCGAYTDGAQVCGDCTERQQAEEAARVERVAQAIADRPADATSGGLCPSCGRYAGPGAKFCGFCRFELRALAPGEGELAYAGFWIRLLAALIDGVILLVINVIAARLIPDPVTAFFAQVFVNATYTIGFWIGQGATPGKMAVGVKVVMANGLPIEFGAACLRYLGYIACILVGVPLALVVGFLVASIMGVVAGAVVAVPALGIGYLMIAFTAEKRGLHDYIAGTVVIKAR